MECKESIVRLNDRKEEVRFEVRSCGYVKEMEEPGGKVGLNIRFRRQENVNYEGKENFT